MDSRHLVSLPYLQLSLAVSYFQMLQYGEKASEKVWVKVKSPFLES